MSGKPLEPGDLVDQRYRVEARLGAGGMGEVFRALDLGRGVEVALKLLPWFDGADPQLLARFQREAELAARLGGEGIVRVHALGFHLGRSYCAMELVRGGDLEAALERGLPRERVLELLADVARTLARCHADGVVHRDVKPQNILLDERGAPRLCDFGLARELGSEERLTRSQDLIGTPSYMAPEQVESSDVGPPADVYSLGVVLYRGLTGRLPFEGSALKVLSDVVSAAPPPPSRFAEVPPGLEALCLRLLAKDPATRPAAAELAERLEAMGRGEGLGARRRGPALAALALLALGLLGAGALAARGARDPLAAGLADAAALSSLQSVGLATPDEPAARRAAAALATLRAAPREGEAARALARLEAWDAWRRAGEGVDPEQLARGGPEGALVAARLLHARGRAERAWRLVEEAARAEPALSAVVSARILLEARLDLARRAAWPDLPTARLMGELEALGRRARRLGLRLAPDPELDAALAAEAPRWAALLRSARPDTGARPEVLARLEALYGGPGLRLAPLLPTLQAWAGEWLAWCREAPVGAAQRARLEATCELLEALCALEPAGWRDPPGLRAELVRYVDPLFGPAGAGGHTTTVAVCLTLLRDGLDGRHLSWPHKQIAIKLAPAAHLEALAQRRPQSRALAYFRCCRLEERADDLEHRAARAQDKRKPSPQLEATLAEAVAELERCVAVAVDGARPDLAPDHRARALYMTCHDADDSRDPRRMATALPLVRRAQALIEDDGDLLQRLVRAERELAQRLSGRSRERDAALLAGLRARMGALRAALPAGEPRVRSVIELLHAELSFARSALDARDPSAAEGIARTALADAEAWSGRIRDEAIWSLRSTWLRALREQGRAREGYAGVAAPEAGVTATDDFALEWVKTLLAVGERERALAALRLALQVHRHGNDGDVRDLRKLAKTMGVGE
ncbi:MAG: protein kinase [Planctomycetota bacterium]